MLSQDDILKQTKVSSTLQIIEQELEKIPPHPKTTEGKKNKPLSLRRTLIAYEAEEAMQKLKIITDSLNYKGMPNPEVSKEIEAFLSTRWDLIKGSSLGYTSMPDGHINKCCVALAEMLHQFCPQKEVIEYLMPTITKKIDVLLLSGGKALKQYKLDELILSDDCKSLIPAELISCIAPNGTSLSSLHNPYVETQGDKVSKLSLNEQRRLIKHSKNSQAFHALYQKILDIGSNKALHSIGAKLTQLIDALKRGGEHGGYGGTSTDAGPAALLGIKEFLEYWDTLDEVQREKIGSLKENNEKSSKSINDILRILKGEDKKSLNCVEVNGNALRRILSVHKDELYNLSSEAYLLDLQKQFTEYQGKMEKGLSGKDKLTINPSLLLHFKILELDGLIIKNPMQAFETLFPSKKTKDKNTRKIHTKYKMEEKIGLLLSMWNILLSKGGNLNDLDKRGMNVLMLAIKNKEVELVQAILMNYGNDSGLLKQKDKMNNNILHLAVCSGNLKLVQALLNNLPSDSLSEMLKQLNKAKYNILMSAVMSGKVEVVNAILAHPNCTSFISDLLTYQDRYGHSALMTAVEEGRVNIVRAILANSNCTPELIKKLLTQGYEDGRSALMVAAQKGNVEMVNAILTSPNFSPKLIEELLTQQDSRGYNALMHGAAGDGNWEIVYVILMNPNSTSELIKNILRQQDNKGYNALMHAVLKPNVGMVRDIMLTIDRCCPELLPELLAQSDREGYNVLMHVVRQNSDDLEYVLNCILSKHYDLGLMSEPLPRIQNKIYLEVDNDVLKYEVISLDGGLINASIPLSMLPEKLKSELLCEEMNTFRLDRLQDKWLPTILGITSKKGHASLMKAYCPSDVLRKENEHKKSVLSVAIAEHAEQSLTTMLAHPCCDINVDEIDKIVQSDLVHDVLECSIRRIATSVVQKLLGSQYWTIDLLEKSKINTKKLDTKNKNLIENMIEEKIKALKTIQMTQSGLGTNSLLLNSQTFFSTSPQDSKPSSDPVSELMGVTTNTSLPEVAARINKVIESNKWELRDKNYLPIKDNQQLPTYLFTAPFKTMEEAEKFFNETKIPDILKKKSQFLTSTNTGKVRIAFPINKDLALLLGSEKPSDLGMKKS